MVSAPDITLDTRNPDAPATLNRTKVRAGPYASAAAGPRLRIHITLKRMWSRPPCRYMAVSSVHHQPSCHATPPVMPSW